MNSTLVILLILVVLVLALELNRIKKERNALRLDWRFCKMLLDISRETHTEDQKEKIDLLTDKVYYSFLNKKIKELGGFSKKNEAIAKESALDSYSSRLDEI
jgi:hypothetical protein